MLATDAALITDGGVLSYAELNTLVLSKCKELETAGVRENLRVAFFAHASVQTIVLILALMRLHAALCPLNVRFPEEKIQSLLKQLDPHFLVCEDSISRMDAHHETLPLAFLLATSGSSGAPKIVALTLGNLEASCSGSMQALPLQEKDVWLLTLPLFHVGGLMILFRAFSSKLAVALSNKPLHEATTKLNATFVSLVPTQLQRLCQAGPVDLKGILMGGAPLSAELYREAQAKGFKLFTSYGMTETTSQVTLDLNPVFSGGLLTSGRVLPHREFSLADDGEILVRGKTLFQGYWHEGKLSLPLRTDGYFATKDRGRLTEDGRLVVLGRKDSLIISGGENIYPEEIEAALLSLPKIFEAIVVPIPDREFGQRPVAFISGHHPFSEKELLEKLRESLPGYMLPRHIFSLPTASGLKRDRVQLAQLAQGLVKE